MTVLPLSLLELLFSEDRDQVLQGREMLEALRPEHPEQATYLESFVRLHQMLFVFRREDGQYVLDQSRMPQTIHGFLQDHVKANLQPAPEVLNHE
jgi:hypothetical protein